MELQAPRHSLGRTESCEPLTSSLSTSKYRNNTRIDDEIRGTKITLEVFPTNASSPKNEVSSEQDIDPRIERRVRWKLDLTILPLLTSVQFLAQMAKSDLGNAEVAGLSEEMKLSGSDYSNLSIMLTVGYLVFQLPGTMLIKKLGPNYQFGGAMVAWGLFTTCVVAAKSLGALMALQFLTGAAEAFIHGTLIYLSFWYRYNELATRGALFDGMAALAGAFNGLMSHSIQVNLDGHNGWRAWRWIFLIEGVVPIGWGFVVAAFLPSSPDTMRRTTIFTPAEKWILIMRSKTAHNTGSSKIRPKAMLEVLLDPIFWVLTLMNCGIHVTTAALSDFLPPILDGLGYEDEKAQLMSSVVYACAFVNIFFCARVADKTNKRGILVVANCIFALVGFGMLLGITDDKARFAGTCLMAMALMPCTMLNMVWLAMNFPGYSYRTSSIAFTNIAAQLFSIIGKKCYTDPPYYRQGLAVSAGMTAMTGLLALGLLWWLQVLNKKKELIKDTTDGLEMSIDDLGNKHADFRYTF